MGRDWSGFIKAVDRAPKEFAKAIVDHLDPPKYAKQALRRLEYLCGWPGCWNRRIDVCFKCHRSICEEHCEMFNGPKTGLEWYVCKSCLDNTPHEELLKEIAEADEEFWLEDQEAEAEQAQLEAEGIEAARAEYEAREEELEERQREASG